MAEAIKSAIGLGKAQEGKEPVSGQQGVGTAAQPYDQGNEEGDPNLGGDAPQNTDPDKVTGEAKPADSTTPSGKSDVPAPEAPAVATAAETSNKEITPAPSNGTHTTQKPSIGSPAWFRTGIPGYDKQKADKPEEAAAGASVAAGNVSDTRTAETTQSSVNGLPSNHPGEEVPPSHATMEENLNKSTNTNAVTSTEPSASTTSPSSNTGESKKEAAQDAGIIGGVTAAAGGLFTQLNPFGASSSSSSPSNAATMDGTSEPSTSYDTTTTPTTNSQQKTIESTAAAAAPSTSSTATRTPSVTVHEPPSDTASTTPSMTAEEKRNGKLPERAGSASTSIDATQSQRRKSHIPSTSVNEGRIPIAGGIPLGQGEMVARRKSTYVAALPSVPGIPEDETTRANTSANVGGGAGGKEGVVQGGEGKVQRKGSVLGRMRSKLGRKK